MSEDFKAILLSLLLFSVGFIAGNEYTVNKQKDKEQDAMMQYLIQQMPNLKSLYGS